MFHITNCSTDGVFYGSKPEPQYHPAEWHAEEFSSMRIGGSFFFDEFGRITLWPSPRSKMADIIRTENANKALHYARERHRQRRLNGAEPTIDDKYEDIV